MQTERSLVIVNFRSAALTARAIQSARAASSTPLEVIVVDNSCDPAEADELRSAGADAVVVAPRNLGYAGGINLALRQSQGATLFAANPDVVFGAHAIDRLEAALDHATMTGPALYWDDARSWILPPAEAPGWRAKASELAALHSRAWSETRDRARVRARVRFWSSSGTREVEAISGAVMCLRTQTLRDLGGMDERFQLYFEEIDLARRIRAAGGTILYVPEAECRHLYNQSASTEEGAAGSMWAASEIEYYRKWSGEGIVRMMRWLGREPGRSPTLVEVSARDLVDLAVDDPSRWVVEASPLPRFDVAAGHFPASSQLRIPDEILASLGGRPLYLRLVEKTTGVCGKTFQVSP